MVLVRQAALHEASDSTSFLGRPTRSRRARPGACLRAGGGPTRPCWDARPGYDRAVPDRLFFTESDEANALIASDPMALLVGFVLDQQVTVQKAFSGPLVLRERLGAIDAATLASADLEPVFRTRPAIHRFPGSMAGRVHALAVHVRDHLRRRRGTRVDRGSRLGRAAREPGGAAGIRRDEDQGSRLRPGQALRGGGRARPRALASDAGGCGFAAGARRLPGGQAHPQGRMVEGRGESRRHRHELPPLRRLRGCRRVHRAAAAATSSSRRTPAARCRARRPLGPLRR